MFARKVAARLKPNSLAQFTQLMESEILPWLRQQEGFLDLITLAAPDGTEVATISFWDHSTDAYAYSAGGYTHACKLLGGLLDSIPYVKTFEVLTSTFQRFAAECSPEAESPSETAGRAYDTSA